MSAAIMAMLAGFAFVSATISAILGMAGGITLLSGMLLVIPVTAAIPLHAVVQLVSNSTRLLVYLKHVRWMLVAYFIPPAALGVWAAKTVFVMVPTTYLPFVIGAFVLFATHMPKTERERQSTGRYWSFSLAGLLSGFLGMFVGASGPIIAPFFLRADILKEELISTKAVCQAIVHLFKLPAFLAIGFAFEPWVPSMAAMVLAVVGGTFLGKRLLQHVSERLFVICLKVVLTAIAAKLILIDGLRLL